MINGCDTEVIVKNNNNKPQFNNSHQRKQPSRHSSPSNHNRPDSTSPSANHYSHHSNNGNNGTFAVGLNGEANSFVETTCLSNDNSNGLSMDMGSSKVYLWQILVGEV
jgi:hypothetical protein